MRNSYVVAAQVLFVLLVLAGCLTFLFPAYLTFTKSYVIVHIGMLVYSAHRATQYKKVFAAAVNEAIRKQRLKDLN